MKWKSIDANATDDNEIIDLAHCGDCDYTGNKGMWKGTKTVAGITSNLEGIVELLSDDTWGLDDILRPDDVEGFDGEAICPICGSLNFY